MILRWTLFTAAAVLLTGCATPRNLERIATVQNRAEALYAYAGVARFPVSSELSEISIYAPVAGKREYPGLAATRENALRPAVSERTQTADAVTKEQAAITKSQESAAQTKEKPLEAAERTDVQAETVVAQEHVATQVEKPQASEVRQQTLSADTQISEQQPTFHKKASSDRATVGEKFSFTMEFQNSTPVDLASVQLTDPIDSRLKLFPDQIKFSPNYKHHVSVGNGQVIIRFTDEIKRGKRVRVTVPVMFPVTSAAAAQ
jgi:uncharacterized repeat protein (TIGR01451 family)